MQGSFVLNWINVKALNTDGQKSTRQVEHQSKQSDFLAYKQGQLSN